MPIDEIKQQAIDKAIASIKQGKCTAIRVGTTTPLFDQLTDADVEYLVNELGEDALVHTLGLASDKITDYGIAQIVRLKKLRCLELDSDSVTNQAAEILAQHPMLAYLYITSCKIDHSGFKALVRNPRIRGLYFYRCNITEVHTEDFVPNTQLTRLSLNNNKIGDKGIEVLTKLPFLKELGISFSKITNKSAPDLLMNTNLIKINITTPIWYKALSAEKELEIEEHVKQNCQRANTRFVQAMLTVFTATSNSNNYTLADLPIELRIHIFKCFDFGSICRRSDLGQACVQFIYNSISEIKQRLQQKVSIQFFHQWPEPRKQWPFFFKQSFSANNASVTATIPVACKRKFGHLELEEAKTVLTQKPRLR